MRRNSVTSRNLCQWKFFEMQRGAASRLAGQFHGPLGLHLIQPDLRSGHVADFNFLASSLLRCGKAPQFSKQKGRRAEKVVCSDLLQPSDFPQLALALKRCRSAELSCKPLSHFRLWTVGSSTPATAFVAVKICLTWLVQFVSCQNSQGIHSE